MTSLIQLQRLLSLIFIFTILFVVVFVSGQNFNVVDVIGKIAVNVGTTVGTKTFQDLINAVSAQSKYGIDYSVRSVSELDSGCTSGGCPKASRLAPKEYDFVIKIPSVIDIQRGYCIRVAPEAKMAIFGKDDQGTGAARFERVVAVTGYYSKGKTFIVNQLFNAIQKKVNGGAWNFWDMFSSSPGLKAGLKMGDGVTTEGFSGIAVDYEDDITKAKTLIIDCAGRNAPGELKSIDPVNKRELLLNEVDDMRAKERLLDDVITTEADIIVYVVDELVNEEQRILLDIIDKLRGCKKKLIVIHNYKRLDHTSNGIKEFISSQIERPFGAKRIPVHDLGFQREEDRENRYEHGFWSSTWKYESDGIEHNTIIVKHVVIFKHEKTNLKPNEAAFTYLASFITDPNESSYANRRPIMERFSKLINFYLNQFIIVEPVSVKLTDTQTGSQLITSPFCDIRKNETHIITSAKFSGVDKKLKVRPWDLVAKAPGDLLGGDYTPHHSVKEVSADGGDYLIIRVDLPGMVEVTTKEEYLVSMGKRSVFLQQKKVKIGNDDYHFNYKITGQRINIHNLDDADDKQSFGNFTIRAKVSNKYKDGTFESTFVNGELIVRITEKKDIPDEDIHEF